MEVDEKREVTAVVGGGGGGRWGEEEASGESGMRVESDVFGGNGVSGGGGGWNDVGSFETLDTTVSEDADETGEIVCYFCLRGGGRCVRIVVHGSD